jgi:hypothetical protein
MGGEKMRLIDADALCRHLSDWQFGSMTDGKHDAEYEVINKVIDGIEQEPTVSPDMAQVLAYECGKDAVQVVRCKDCYYWSGLPKEEHALCSVYDNVYAITPRDGFCHKGRRSE